MYYVEILFARSRLFWFTVVALLVAAVFSYFVTFPPPHAHIRNNGQDVSFDGVLIFAGFFAMIMASMLGATLNRDGSHLPYIWTKPVARERIALTYMAIDVLTILASFGVIVAVCSIVLAIPPQNPLKFDDLTGAILARTLAVPLMLYGIIEVSTSWTPMRLGAAGGIIWPVSLAVEFLAAINLPFPLGQIFYVINVFNPIAYLSGLHGSSHVQVTPSEALPFDFTTQTILAFCIFVAGCVIATYNWKRMQA
jgi:hypothetical protein